jgi:hypothetical protein
MSRAITRSLLALAAVLAFCAGAAAQDEGDGEPASVIATQADAGSDAAIARRLDATLGEIEGLEACA